MQIVIDIPTDTYEYIKEGTETSIDESEVVYAVKHGIVFPENHGRLIDADLLSCKMFEECFIKDSVNARWDSGLWLRYLLFEHVLNNTPTVIEADGKIEAIREWDRRDKE